jgi:FkbM family methyltransferase
MESCTFTNDNNVSILLLEHPFSDVLRRRDAHEVIFRRINTYLIQRGIIKNNIIDLGAWIGDNSLPWAKTIEGCVYSIDPSEENCSFIRDTCELNKITNVKVIQTAISDKNEILSTTGNIQHCSFVYDNTASSIKTFVEAVSLDYLFETKRIENIGYIHLDVEGMEYAILRGSSTIIDRCRPVLTFEQHLEIDDYSKILAYLTEKNYKVFLINEVLPGCRHDCRNSLAFPNEMYNEDTENILQDIHDTVGKNVLIPQYLAQHGRRSRAL